ncbi:protein-L-isoaspartate O-methyltransferase [Halobacteriales archaeon SW_7_68_16]|nr:MAG: protein-L-isoaspartate O-methyltransferase [Halobacteriales archaeon SW_7_68_16]
MVGRLREYRTIHDATAAALRAVPRHEFVPGDRRDEAYDDRPLPIGDGQTISAPHVVARMCDLLELGTGDRTLEIGTGCGYHAAVTAELVGSATVHSVEYSRRLAASARDRLDRLGYGGISIRVGDGREGWPDHAPYDAGYLTCAVGSFPESVVAQLRDGGRLVGPIGHGGVRFVEMRG